MTRKTLISCQVHAVFFPPRTLRKNFAEKVKKNNMRSYLYILIYYDRLDAEMTHTDGIVTVRVMTIFLETNTADANTVQANANTTKY